MTIFTEKFSSKNTIESYRRDLVKFYNFIQKNLNECSKQDILNFLSFLYDLKSDSKTVSRHLSSIRQFYKFLFREKIILDNPVIDIESPKIQRKLPKIAEENDVIELLNFASKDQSINGIKVSLILEILYGTGIRVSELIKIKISDFISSEDGFFLIVCGKGNKERIVPFNDAVTNILKIYMEINNIPFRSKEFLFKSDYSSQNHITRQRVGQILKEIMIKSGMNFSISPHKMRHFFATHMLENNCSLVVVKDILGHSDISSTQIYTHVMASKLRDITEKFHPLSKQKISGD